MQKWLSEGKINVKETVTEGIENWPHAFIQLFNGDNIGKVVVKI
jgi:NADPH-dependent curcumin reductase CurA